MKRNNGAYLVRRPDAALVRQSERYVTPETDIFETASEFLLRIDMPGSLKESIKVFLDGDLMTVRGSIVELYGEHARLLAEEIARKNYYRIFNLGRGVDRESIEAEYEEGVLTIRVPKSDDMKTREIPIQ